MSPYPDQANKDLLERIPLSASVVLDVGCHTGALGAAYRRLNPRARLLGIEKDPAAAELAAQRRSLLRSGSTRWRWWTSSKSRCRSRSTARSTASCMATPSSTCAIRGR